MADPAGFNSMIDVAYIVASVVTLVFAGTGYLMFGGSVSSEVTRDIARTAGYPVALNKLAIWMVAVSRFWPREKSLATDAVSSFCRSIRS